MQLDMYTRRRKRSLNTTVTVAAIAAALNAGALTRPASAHGAVVIGVPANVARDGVAVGLAWDIETEAGAIELATKYCRTFSGVPQSTLKLCKLERTFVNQCVVAAFDPKPDTPGWGWAIAGSSQEAEKIALDACKRSAGKDREAYCELATTRCDGQAK